ncbi:signal peptidase I [Amycolatopsis magusensis]|uniref:signal peptidase I n=1 Tax=Amycolatopsis magusensis TaxID=882444 RepID=UPI0037922A8D
MTTHDLPSHPRIARDAIDDPAEQLDAMTMHVEGDNQWTTGNAAADSARTKGWLVGHFIPAGNPRHAADVEIKWGTHRQGERRSEWARGGTQTTVSLLVSGRFRVDFPGGHTVLARVGDYVMWGPGIDHSWEAIDDSVIVTIRWPSSQSCT